jgi:hypothetical protein
VAGVGVAPVFSFQEVAMFFTILLEPGFWCVYLIVQFVVIGMYFADR